MQHFLEIPRVALVGQPQGYAPTRGYLRCTRSECCWILNALQFLGVLVLLRDAFMSLFRYTFHSHVVLFYLGNSKLFTYFIA